MLASQWQNPPIFFNRAVCVDASNLPPKIAFIDSGIGGFSIVQSVVQSIPFAEYVYFMDNQFLPYGELSDSFLRERLLTIADYLLTFYQPDVIVVACNTASTLTLSQLRECFSVPFVGVVPAIKPAAETTQTGKVVLLATPSTVKNPYTHALMHNFASGVSVEMLGSSCLVKWAETLFWQEKPCSVCEVSLVTPIQEFMQKHQPLFADADRVVLGCTHFPFLKEILQQNLPEHVVLIDSAEAVARQTRTVLFGASNRADGWHALCHDGCIAPRVEVLHTANIPDNAFECLSTRLSTPHISQVAVSLSVGTMPITVG